MADEAVAVRLARFFNAAMECSWDGRDFDGCSIQEEAAKLGLIVETTYDPTIHGDNDGNADPGESWFVMADDVKRLLPKATHPTPEEGE